MITSDFFVADSLPLSFTLYERKQYSFVCLFNTLRPIHHNLSLLLSQSVVLSHLSFGFYRYLSVSLPMKPKLHLVVRSSEFHLLKISPSAGRVWKRYFGRRSNFNSITLIESDKNVHFLILTQFYPFLTSYRSGFWKMYLFANSFCFVLASVP